MVKNQPEKLMVSSCNLVGVWITLDSSVFQNK